MRYEVTVTTNTGKVYQFVMNDYVASEFKDFVDGIDKKQFYTISASMDFVMLSRKSIEHVYFHGVKDNG